eukprot:8802389-Pyramimonas_sp.AAC.1
MGTRSDVRTAAPYRRTHAEALRGQLDARALLHKGGPAPARAPDRKTRAPGSRRYPRTEPHGAPGG